MRREEFYLPRSEPMNEYLERVVDLLDPSLNLIHNMSVDDARARILTGPPEAVREIDGSFALIARDGKSVRMARSLDRPMRYFLAKRREGPALLVADRIDALYAWLESEGLEDQFHPSYSRMVPAHHVVEIHLVGCPDPAPLYTRYFNPVRETQPPDLDIIGRRYIGALADEIAKWLRHLPEREPVGVPFSGGIDSGAVFLTTYHVLRQLGMSPARLKAFTLTFGESSDLDQARRFLDTLGLGLFLEPIEAEATSIEMDDTIRIVEDYKPLDIESATMSLALSRGIRARYPEWRHLIDGDGGDENLKDYPIEENPELTIQSVIHNQMLYHEGWGVGKLKHSLTYSGGLSRSYTRNYATARHCDFHAFSPFTRPAVIEIAEGIPFIALTRYDVPTLYALKGEIVGRGVKAITGLDMPIFPKRRFQHGALPPEQLRDRLPVQESVYRRAFLALYE
jgi:asparagine synthase (glutamine-hydrolysing)